MLTLQLEKLLKKIYETPSHEGSFTAPLQLKRILKTKYKQNVSLEDVKDWLTGQRSYTYHKRVRHNFPGNPIIAHFTDDQWESDLMFLPDLAKFNDGFKIALVCVDVVSRFAWVEPMKTKHGEATAQAMKNLLKKSAPRKPFRLHTDKGTEFFNSHFKALMRDKKIAHFATSTDRSKAAIAERFNRTLKEKIYKFLDSNPSNSRYLDVLQDLVDSYNNTHHSAIKMKPSDVNHKTEATALWNLYHEYWTDEKDAVDDDDDDEKQKCKPSASSQFQYRGTRDHSNVRNKNVRNLLHIGDTVRIAGKKHPFTKSYKGLWTEELFTISNIHKRHPYFVYEVQEADGEPLDGMFYREELQKVKPPKTSDFWQVEKIMRKRKKKGTNETEYLVKWFGYAPKYNSWVRESDMKSTK
jgi:transposase InsO family protein